MVVDQEEEKRKKEERQRQQSLATTPQSEQTPLQSIPDTKKPEEIAEPPPRPDAPVIIRNQDTGKPSGISFPDGRQFLGISPQEIQQLSDNFLGKRRAPEGTVEQTQIGERQRAREFLTANLPQGAQETAEFDVPQGILDTPLANSIKGKLVRLDAVVNSRDPIGALTGKSLAEQNALIRQQGAIDTDQQILELGFAPVGSFATRAVIGGVSGAAGGAISLLFSKPVLSLIDFDREAKALTQAIPDAREQIDRVVSNTELGVYSVNQGRQRLDALEFRVSEIEARMRATLASSPSIATSGELPQMIEKLNKFKEQLAGAKQQMTLIEARGKFDVPQEDLVEILREIQAERG